MAEISADTVSAPAGIATPVVGPSADALLPVALMCCCMLGPEIADGFAREDGTRETLTVQITGGRAASGAVEPDTVLVLDRPAGGRVAVREFPSPGAPVAYDARAEDVLARVEGAARAGRRVSAELYLVREWLAGRA